MKQIALFSAAFATFLAFQPDALDARVFVAMSPLTPYATPGFVNPPWVALVVAPLALVPERVAIALILAANVTALITLAQSRGAGLAGLVMLATSYPFMEMLQSGAIEFVPALGLLAGGELGAVLLLGKPQSGAGVLVRRGWTIPQVITLGVLLALSFIAWPGWVGDMLTNAAAVPMERWNIAPWPWGIPAGLALIVLGRGELSALVATVLLVPYIAPHSLVIAYAVLVSKRPRLGALVWVAGWVWVVGRVL